MTKEEMKQVGKIARKTYVAVIDAVAKTRLGKNVIVKRQGEWFRLPVKDSLEKLLLYLKSTKITTIDGLLKEAIECGFEASGIVKCEGETCLGIVHLDVKRDKNGDLLTSCVSKNCSMTVIDSSRNVVTTKNLGEKVRFTVYPVTEKKVAKVAKKEKKRLKKELIEKIEKNVQSIDSRFIRLALRNVFKNIEFTSLDNEYRITSLANIKKILELNKIDKKEYSSEHYDCDNFSFSLKIAFAKFGITGASVVIDKVASHAYIAVCTIPKGKINLENLPDVYFIEPQSDKFVSLNTSKGSRYDGRDVIIITF